MALFQPDPVKRPATIDPSGAFCGTIERSGGFQILHCTYSRSLYCIALYGVQSTEYCPALHCTALHCTAQLRTYQTSKHFPAVEEYVVLFALSRFHTLLLIYYNPHQSVSLWPHSP
jgi:hypothetical protein